MPCDHDDEIAELRGQVAAHERALTDEVVRGHLEGRDTIGLYPLLVGGTCRLQVCDFDTSSWKLDAQAYVGVVVVAMRVRRVGADQRDHRNTLRHPIRCH